MIIDPHYLIVAGGFYTLAVLFVGYSFGWCGAEKRYRNPKSVPAEHDEHFDLFI